MDPDGVELVLLVAAQHLVAVLRPVGRGPGDGEDRAGEEGINVAEAVGHGGVVVGHGEGLNGALVCTRPHRYNRQGVSVIQTSLVGEASGALIYAR